MLEREIRNAAMTVRGSDLRLSDESSLLRDGTSIPSPDSSARKMLKNQSRDSTFEDRFIHNSLPVHFVKNGIPEPMNSIEYDDNNFVLRAQTGFEE